MYFVCMTHGPRSIIQIFREKDGDYDDRARSKKRKKPAHQATLKSKRKKKVTFDSCNIYPSALSPRPPDVHFLKDELVRCLSQNFNNESASGPLRILIVFILIVFIRYYHLELSMCLSFNGTCYKCNLIIKKGGKAGERQCVGCQKKGWLGTTLLFFAKEDHWRMRSADQAASSVC